MRAFNNLGVVAHAVELDMRCDGKTGMDYVKSKLSALNYAYCWGIPDKWSMINRMLWRFDAMYNGGDWFFVDSQLYKPHERLWTFGRNFNWRNYGFRKANMSIDMLKEQARTLHNRRHGGQR